MKKWIRQYLGIDDLVSNEQMIFNELGRLHAKTDQVFISTRGVKTEIAIHNRALARFIAKLDPMFAEDEMSPARKAESDKLTEQVIRKLVGEHLASRAPGDNA